MDHSELRELFADVLEELPRERHEDFLRLVETGEASDEFRDYMDTDPACLAAIDKAFHLQARRLKGRSGAGAPGRPRPAWSRAVRQLAAAIRTVTSLTPRERDQAIADVEAELRAANVPRDEVRDVLSEIDSDPQR